jgi:hypothetical protein
MFGFDCGQNVNASIDSLSLDFRADQKRTCFVILELPTDEHLLDLATVNEEFQKTELARLPRILRSRQTFLQDERDFPPSEQGAG